MGWVIVYIQIQLFLLRKWEASEGREYNRREAFGTIHYMSELSELKVPLSLFLTTISLNGSRLYPLSLLLYPLSFNKRAWNFQQ